MRITLHQLKVFDTVATHSGFSRASKVLHLTQLTVSMQVKQLADAVGTPLFEQIGKKIFLTEAGTVVQGAARQMFDVIEQARMMVGTKAISALSTGYLNALDYAKHRVQGAELPQMMDKSAPRVTITHHPDVRRSLMMQKAYAEGMRALVMYTAWWQDQVELNEAGAHAEVDLDISETGLDDGLPDPESLPRATWGGLGDVRELPPGPGRAAVPAEACTPPP